MVMFSLLLGLLCLDFVHCLHLQTTFFKFKRVPRDEQMFWINLAVFDFKLFRIIRRFMHTGESGVNQCWVERCKKMSIKEMNFLSKYSDLSLGARMDLLPKECTRHLAHREDLVYFNQRTDLPSKMKRLPEFFNSSVTNLSLNPFQAYFNQFHISDMRPLFSRYSSPFVNPLTWHTVSGNAIYKPSIMKYFIIEMLSTPSRHADLAKLVNFIINGCEREGKCDMESMSMAVFINLHLNRKYSQSGRKVDLQILENLHLPHPSRFFSCAGLIKLNELLKEIKAISRTNTLTWSAKHALQTVPLHNPWLAMVIADNLFQGNQPNSNIVPEFCLTLIDLIFPKWTDSQLTLFLSFLTVNYPQMSSELTKDIMYRLMNIPPTHNAQNMAILHTDRRIDYFRRWFTTSPSRDNLLLQRIPSNKSSSSSLFCQQLGNLNLFEMPPDRLPFGGGVTIAVLAKCISELSTKLTNIQLKSTGQVLVTDEMAKNVLIASPLMQLPLIDYAFCKLLVFLMLYAQMPISLDPILVVVLEREEGFVHTSFNLSVPRLLIKDGFMLDETKIVEELRK